ATSLKDVGRFILQTQTDGPVSMLVVDVRMPAQIRATASFDADALQAASGLGGAEPASLLGTGTLAMTIEQGQTQQRYQGYVPLEGATLEVAAHTYFRQSEQIPTRIRLSVAEMFDRDEAGATRQSWRAGGIIGQFLPVSEDRLRHRDLPAGDLPEGAEPAEDPSEDEAWREAQALIDTVEDHELTDPAISAERLLFRLFHERGVRAFDAVRIEENCSCSREKIHNVLTQMGPEDIAAASKDGHIDVRCEFCGTRYRFDPSEFATGEG
ncbi:MAG TPA: Hsp33 family molecular chaperone, partial [Bryobacteraceae bacterium]|nr:Hsp33 family molecular chaperone [Bryobacteraceae bacterium]